MKGFGLDLPETFPSHSDAAFFGELLGSGASVMQHLGEGCGVQMALIEGDAAFFDDAGDDAGFGDARANRANAAVTRGDGINFLGHFSSGEKCVLTAVHGCAAGVRRLALKSDGVALDTVGSEDGAEGQIQVKQNGALLDVEFEVGGGVVEFAVAIFDTIEIDSVFGEGGGKFDAVLIFERAGFVEIEAPGAGGRSKEAPAKTRSFFVGPINEANGDRGMAGVLGGDAAESFQSSEEIQSPIKPAAVGNGIDMTADEEGFFGLSGQGRPEVAGGVLVNLDGELTELVTKPMTGATPRRGEGNALSAVFVGGESAQFLEFGDGPLWVKHTDTWVSVTLILRGSH